MPAKIAEYHVKREYKNLTLASGKDREIWLEGKCLGR